MRDKQFDYIDRGWAAMKDTLDREMPEGKRRMLIWWWLPLGLAVAILWWWIGFSQNPEPPDDPHQQASSPVAISNQAVPPSNGQTESMSFVAPSEPTRRGSQIFVPELSKEEKPETSTRHAFFVSPLPVRKEEILAESYPYTFPEVPMIRFFPQVIYLPGRQSDFFTLQSFPDAIPTPMFFWAPGQWWVSGVSHWGDASWVSGMSLGVFWRKPFHKWHIDAGLEIGHHQLALSEKTGALEESAAQDAPVMDTGTQQDQEAMEPLPEALGLWADQASGRVMLHRQLGKGWAISLGTQINYWARVRQEWSYTPTSDVTNAFQVNDRQAAISGQKGQVLGRDQVSPWSLGLESRLTYQWHPRWEAMVGYHYGLSDQSEIPGYSLYNHFGRLGIHYRLR